MWSAAGDCYPIGSYTYKFFRDGVQSGSGNFGSNTTATYNTASADKGHTITAQVTVCDTHNNCTSANPATNTYIVPAPALTSGPSISGGSTVGSTLTASDTWNSYGLADNVTRQWQRCGYRNTVVSDGPADYWRLGETSTVAPTARDAMEAPTGTYNPGTYVRSPTLGVAGALNGDSNTAVTFNSSSAQYVGLANTVQFDSGPFTIEAWAKTTSSTQTQTIWDSGNNGSNPGQVIEVRFSIAGQVQLFVENASGTTLLLQSGSTWNDGAWHYIVATRSVSGGNDTYTLYVDGTQVNTATGASYGDLDAAGAPARIGNGVGPRDGFWFNGSIDDVAVYKKALTSTQVASHYNAGTNITNGCVNIAGATDTTYMPSSADFGSKLRYSVYDSNSDGTSSTYYSPLTADISSGVSGDDMAPVGSIATLTPTLSADRESDLGGEPVDYQFQVTTTNDGGFSNPIADSGWLPATNTWAVPQGTLGIGTTYLWRVRARDTYGTTAWTGDATITVQLPMLGESSASPMFNHGPIAVNEANGNLVLSAPTPSYPTATGTLSFALTDNSQSTTSTTGLGTGWTLTAGDALMSPPQKLIDWASQTPSMDAAEIDWPDGSSAFYSEVGTSNIYIDTAGDGNQLTKNPGGSGGWTLLTADGSSYNFGPESSGTSLLVSAQTPASSNGDGILNYTFSSGEITMLTYKQNNLPGSDSESLTFNWSCGTNVLFCVTGPDGKTWTYHYDGGHDKEITSITNGGGRELMAITYSGSMPTKIQNADDLDPTHASPGYNSSHSIQIHYSAQVVDCVLDGPISDQTAISWPSGNGCGLGPGPVFDSIWTFTYAHGPNPCPTLQTPADSAHRWTGVTVGGCTTVVNPDQQPGGAGTQVIYDKAGHPLEYDDARLGSGNNRVTLSLYTATGELEWTEDAAGNPTDYTYDPTTHALTQVQETSPASGQPRPATLYRYDEQTVGTASTAGNPLTGLAGTYWGNQNLAGQPSLRENDPAPGSSTTTFTLPTGSSWPVSGTSSARWNGYITAPYTGDYTFSTISDGGTRLNIDGIDAVDSWTIPTNAPATFLSDPIYLVAGTTHQIDLQYEHTGSNTPSLALDWTCGDCSTPIASAAVPVSDLAPGWENQTSVVSPAGRISFQHYLHPETGEPDYSLVQVGSQNLITSYTYDSLGRMTSKFMPMANANAVLDSVTGDITPNYGANYKDYETDYAYYGAGDGGDADDTTGTDTDGDAGTTGESGISWAAPPSACAAGSAVNQYGQLESTSSGNPLGLHSVVTVYNAAGLPIAVTDGAGTSCRTYDSDNRLHTQTPAGSSSTTTFGYDPNGTQLTATDATGTVTDSYDEAGRLIGVLDASGAQASYSYDPDGNLTEQQTAIGLLSSSTNYDTYSYYDAADELQREVDPDSNTYYFYYDTLGNLRGTQYPNGTFSWVDTNPDGWIADQYNRHGSISGTTTTAPADSLSSPLADFTYTYDADGKRLSEVRTSGSTSQTTNYGYDNAGRLSQVLLPSGTCRDYSYDLDSNRTQTSESTTGCSGTFSTTASLTYDPTNANSPGTDELTSIIQGGNTTNYAYTADGQTSSQGTTSFTWDGYGRLSTTTVGSNTVSYTDDATGALMTRTSSSPSSTTHYLLGDTFETDGSSTITASYAPGPAGNLASFSGAPTGTPTFLYYDAHGNLAAEADTSGTQTANHTYDPFGAPLDSVPTNITVHRFVGRWNKQYDTANGLILMGARPYDPNTGRFLSVDPVPGGSLNNYDYAGQDPINNYDLNGECYANAQGRCGQAAGNSRRQRFVSGMLYLWYLVTHPAYVWEHRAELLRSLGVNALRFVEWVGRELGPSAGVGGWLEKHIVDIGSGCAEGVRQSDGYPPPYDYAAAVGLCAIDGAIGGVTGGGYSGSSDGSP